MNYLSSILKFLAYQNSFWEEILTKAFCRYILNLKSKKKLGSFNDWNKAYFQSFICLPRYEYFLASSFSAVSSALPKRIQSILERLKENTTKAWKPSIIDESKCFVQIQEIEYFECSWCQNISPLMNKSMLFLQLLVDHMLTELYLQNWVAGLVVLHSFLSKGLTWYVHLKVLARCVNNIFCLHKE